jgi:hypothetical protein
VLNLASGNLFIDHGATVTVLSDIIFTVQGKVIINP